MSKRLMESELILNSDGSIYHLNLLPEDIAETIILVGDPNRVKQVSKHFDRIQVQKTKREFVTHTGEIGGKRLSVVGTGIGAGNIDIAMNELDALVNIDLKNRAIKNHHRQLRFIRLGTSGALQENIPVDSFLISTFGVGLDGLMSYYDWENNSDEDALLNVCHDLFSKTPFMRAMYAAEGSRDLIQLCETHQLGSVGITLTCPGFYGAQSRALRIPLSPYDLFSLARHIHFKQQCITNLEMETSAIYGLARLLNHEACSISAIVANRYTQTFSADPDKTIDRLIQQALAMVIDLHPFDKEDNHTSTSFNIPQ